MSATKEQQEAVRALVDSVIEMEAYHHVPGTDDDPVWLAIRRRGAEAMRKAKAAGFAGFGE